MKTEATYVWITIAGLLVCVTGCGKSDYPTPPTTSQISEPVKTEPPAKVATQPASSDSKPVEPKSAATPLPPVQVPTPLTETSPPTPVKAAEVTPPATNTAANVPVPATQNLSAVSQDQATLALQQALGKGLQQAIARLGHEGGFLTNLNVRIPMPESLQKVEGTLRAMKQEKLVDEFVVTMNRAAEQAVPEAGTVFASALKQMTIDDARSILTGPDDAATQYFRRTTETNLYAKFLPVVQKATQQTGVTSAYKNLLEKAKGAGGLTQKLGGLGSAVSGTLLGQESLDIDAYVTRKAMDGLFKTVAEEEKQIRNNPVARTTDLLQKVFGSLKK